MSPGCTNNVHNRTSRVEPDSIEKDLPAASEAAHSRIRFWPRAEGLTVSVLCGVAAESEVACAVPKPGSMGSEGYDRWWSSKEPVGQLGAV